MEQPPVLMGKSTISMAMFNSYVKLPEGSSMFLLKGLQSFNIADIAPALSRSSHVPGVQLLYFLVGPAM